MGFEIRRVPAGWQHQRYIGGENRPYIPKREQNYPDAIKEWYLNHQLWLDGTHPDQRSGTGNPAAVRYWADWAGEAPATIDHVDYLRKDATHFQLYETVSLGTPASPVFATPRELEQWMIGEAMNQSDKGFSIGVITAVLTDFYEDLCEPGMGPEVQDRYGMAGILDVFGRFDCFEQVLARHGIEVSALRSGLGEYYAHIEMDTFVLLHLAFGNYGHALEIAYAFAMYILIVHHGPSALGQLGQPAPNTK